MWACVIVAVFCAVLVAAAPQTTCPLECHCSTEGTLYTARCTSLYFLSKSSHSKQFLQIQALHVTNQSISYASKLHKLLNLRALDLSYNQLQEIPNLSKLSALMRLNLKSNNIRTINTSALPASLKDLDLSRNNIKNVPDDLKLLDNLVYLNLVKNPLHCTCGSIQVRDVLLERSVRIDEPVVCAAPEKYKSKLWHSISCDSDSLKKVEDSYDRMVADEAIAIASSTASSTYMLSDEGADELGTHIEDSGENDEMENVESDFITIKSDKRSNGAVTHSPLSEDEGSGGFSLSGSGDEGNFDIAVTEDSGIIQVTTEDEGSGEFTTPMDERTLPPFGSLVPECLIPPCPTSEDGLIDNSNDVPNISDGISTVFYDILGSDEETSSPVPSTTTKELIEVFVSTSAPRGSKVAPAEAKNENDNGLEQMTIEEPEAKQSTSTYILLFMLLLIVVALLIYAVFTKRQAKRKYRCRNENAKDVEKPSNKDVEMKLLSETPTDNNKPQNGITESTPLVNGNNENQNGTNGKLKPSPYEADSDAEQESVELRKNGAQVGLLTPEAQRVTIKVSELPDSLPKTPILVNRQISTDGRTITTPSYDQRFK